MAGHGWAGRSWTISIGFLAWALAPSGAVAAETCFRQGGQYADTRTCVSSVLAPQGGNSYGPNHLAGHENTGAWCEGVAGPGIGQTVTVHQDPANVIGTVLIANGYGKTSQTYRANGRVKRARIETSGGYGKTVTLKDTREEEEIKIPPSKVSWVRLTILDVYPGERHNDTCITRLYFNHEEFGALEEPRDEPQGNSK